ncbi:MAG: hypothetical protein WAK82_08845 [Streptosporangiaceae bacterium]
MTDEITAVGICLEEHPYPVQPPPGGRASAAVRYDELAMRHPGAYAG